MSVFCIVRVIDADILFDFSTIFRFYRAIDKTTDKITDTELQ